MQVLYAFLQQLEVTSMKLFQTTTFFATMFLATSLVAGPQSDAGAAERERGKPAEACEKQYQQCMKPCDKEKRMWFFKGEAYDTCAEKCEARLQSCMSTGRGMPTGDDAADRRETMREDAAERREEIREDTDERREEMREDADERRKEMREDADQRRDEARAAAEERRGEDDEAEAEAEDDDGDGNDRGKGKGKDKGKGKNENR